MSYNSIEGKLDASGHKYGIVVSRFNDFLTDKLVAGAVDCLVRHGADDSNITVVRVPGAFEIPYAASKMVAGDAKYDAIICLGAVIRGNTPHFDFISSEAAKGVARIGIESSIPVIFGIVTADTLEQAIERSGTKAGNKGADAAVAAIEMIDLYRQIK
jgi:6,7-dimethyl-8-ribityllumazine synthase